MTQNDPAQQAAFADAIERHDLVVKILLEEVRPDYAHSKKEFELLTVAFKVQVNKLRNALQLIEEQRAKSPSPPAYLAEYAQTLRARAEACARQFLTFLATQEGLALQTSDKIHQADVLKLKADFNRYLCEVIEPGAGEVLHAEIEELYRASIALLDTVEDKYFARKLAAQLNCAVFAFEVRRQRREGLRLLTAVYEQFLGDYGRLGEEVLKECSPVFKIIDESLKAWQKEAGSDRKGQAF